MPDQEVSEDSRSDQPTPAQLVHSIRYIDDRERLYGFLGAGLGFVLGIVLTILAIHDNPPLHHKNHSSTSLILTFGVVRILLPVLVLVGAWIRRRAIIGFALLFVGASSTNLLLALPFFALGAVIVVRAYKYQKQLKAIGGDSRRARSSTPREKTKPSSSTITGPARPTASKRYTPPRAPARKTTAKP